MASCIICAVEKETERSTFGRIKANQKWGQRIRTSILALLLAAIMLGIAGTRDADAGKTKLVMAFYYAWFDPTSFGPGKTPFNPIHPYFSTSAANTRRQINTARAAGIDGFIQSWYGPNPNQQTEPNFAQLLNIAQESGFKATVHFEVASPFFGGNQDRINALKTLLNTHAKHSAFLRVDGKPVIFFWASWYLPISDWQYIRNQVDPNGTAIWIAEGGHTDYLSVFDGLHLYNVAWSANPAGINARWAGETRAAAETYGTYKYWAGTAMPGFNNSLVPGAEVTVRGRGNGSYLRESFNGAANTSPDILLVTSFNEWPEASGIEPSKEYGNTYINILRELSAGYKGIGSGSFPPIPAWPAPAPTATPVPPPTNTPLPQPTNTPWPTNTPRATRASTTGAGSTNQGIGADPTVAPTAIPKVDEPVAVAAVNTTTQEDGTTFYSVQAGDTLLGIALRFGLSLDELLALNGLTRESLLSVGQVLIIAGEPETSATEAPSTPTPEPAAPTATPEPEPIAQAPDGLTTRADGAQVYAVETGDNLTIIAVKFGLSVAELAAQNGISEDAFLSIGQELVIVPAAPPTNVPPTPEPVAEEPEPVQVVGLPEPQEDGSIVYEMQAGETYESVAAQFGLLVDKLLELNRLDGSRPPKQGQRLLLAEPVVEQAAAEPASAPADQVVPLEAPAAEPISLVPPQFEQAIEREDGAFVHRVGEGQTLIEIALLFGYTTMDEFYAVSGLSDASLLTVGQEVVVGFKPQPAEQGGSTDSPTETPAPLPTATFPPTPAAPTAIPTAARTLPPPPTRVATEEVAAIFPTPQATIIEPSGDEQSQSALSPIADLSTDLIEQPPDRRTIAFIGLFGSLILFVSLLTYLIVGRTRGRW